MADAANTKVDEGAEAPKAQGPVKPEEVDEEAAKAAKRAEIVAKVKAAQDHELREKQARLEAFREAKKEDSRDRREGHGVLWGARGHPLRRLRHRAHLRIPGRAGLCKSCSAHDICESCYDAWAGGDGVMPNKLSMQVLSTNPADHSFKLHKDQTFKSVVKGDKTTVKSEPKLKPNDTCSCGSGKKYKEQLWAPFEVSMQQTSSVEDCRRNILCARGRRQVFQLAEWFPEWLAGIVSRLLRREWLSRLCASDVSPRSFHLASSAHREWRLIAELLLLVALLLLSNPLVLARVVLATDNQMQSINTTPGESRPLYPVVLLKDFLTAQLDSKLASVKAEIIGEFATQLKGPLGAVVGQQQQRNAHFTGQTQSLQATSSKLEAEQAELRVQIAEMRQRLYMQEAQIPIKDYENLIEWDRPADTSIIVGTAAENFTLDEFKASIQPIIDRCEFGDGEWEAVGQSPARRFLIEFSGDANASARRVRTFYSKLKGADGEWLNTMVNSVHGIIYCNNLPILSISVGSTKDGPTKLLFNYQGCLTHGINREDVRAKFEEDPLKRKKKVTHMLQVLNSTSVLAMQEVHGSETELAHTLHLGHKSAAIFISIPERGTGGVATVLPGLSQEEAADPDRFRRTAPVPGRAQRLQIKSDLAGAPEGAQPSMAVIYNVHNFHLAQDQVQRTVGTIRAELSVAEQRPERITAMIMSDFNFMDEAPLEMTAPLVNKGLPRLRNVHPEHQLLWEQAPGDMVEVDPELHAHYTEHSQQCARIDKIYTSSPPWLLTQWCAKVDMPMAPDMLYDKGISDHAPARLRLSARARADRESQPIPQYIFEHPLFIKYFDLLVSHADLDSYTPCVRLQELKRLIREAARLTRNDLTDVHAPCSAAALTTCRAISRAVWRNDWQSARTLKARTELGDQFLDISDPNNIALIEPGTFRRVFEQRQKSRQDQRTEALLQGESAADTPFQQRQRLRKMRKAIQKRGKLWAPTGKTLKLKAIGAMHDHSTTQTPAAMIEELRRQWSPVFQAKPSHLQHVKRYLEKHIVPYDCTDMDIPSLGKMKNLISRLNNLAPGPDGIPYMAWKRIPSSAQLMLDVTIEIMQGYPVPLTFNDSLMIFTPKGSEPADEHGATSVFYAAELLARLVLKTAKCKIIPLAGSFSPAVVDRVRAKIEALVPKWSGMTITDMAEYLGVLMGPSVDNLKRWQKLVAGWQRATNLIADTNAPTSTSLMLYNPRAVTKISYFSQLFLWPPKMKRKENWALHRIWHLPPQALPRDDLLRIGDWSSSLKAVSLEVSNRAALMRSATDSVKNWPHWSAKLKEAAAVALPFYDLALGMHAPSHWRSPPIALTLEEAAGGFTNDPNELVATVCGQALNEWRAEKARLMVARPNPRLRMQKHIHSHLVPSLLVDRLPSTFLARLNSWSTESQPYVQAQIEWEPLKVLLKSDFSPASHSALLETWAGGWATGRRLHSRDKSAGGPCVFGCKQGDVPDASDSISHYMHCAHMSHAVCTVWHVRLLAPSSLPARLGLCSGESDEYPQRVALERTTIAFHLYNIQSKLPPGKWILPEPVRLRCARGSAAVWPACAGAGSSGGALRGRAPARRARRAQPQRARCRARGGAAAAACWGRRRGQRGCAVLGAPRPPDGEGKWAWILLRAVVRLRDARLRPVRDQLGPLREGDGGQPDQFRCPTSGRGERGAVASPTQQDEPEVCRVPFGCLRQPQLGYSAGTLRCGGATDTIHAAADILTASSTPSRSASSVPSSFGRVRRPPLVPPLRVCGLRANGLETRGPSCCNLAHDSGNSGASEGHDRPDGGVTAGVGAISEPSGLRGKQRPKTLSVDVHGGGFPI
ncbi:unnamed protein product [Prorocentrum cordatum]|uniref:Uncharacterized protein n=1 Tax=Prorocentrum cordatum TaxID=2364126 RepID=A0ABN9TIR8_9DINO|nr:unnamed protein product [Polarella glacialis]